MNNHKYLLPVIVLSFLALITGGLVLSEGITELVGMGLLLVTVLIYIIALFYSFSECKKSDTMIVSTIGFVEITVLFLLTGPAWHWLLMPFFTNPWILEVLALIILGIIIFFMLVQKAPIIATCIIISLFIIAIVITIFAASYTSCALSERLDISEVDTLPIMDEDYLRITPKVVASRYAVDMCQYPRHQPLKPPDIVMINNEPHWSYILSPDGLFNVYNIKPTGIAYIDMTTMNKNVDIKEDTIKYSDGIQMKDELQWQILSNQYWITLDRPMALMYNNEQYIAKPYVTYEHRFSFPIWYTVPIWGGVYLADSDGNIQNLNPEQARASPVLQNQKMFPEILVNEYILSQNYWKAREGDYIGAIFNVWFDHKEQIEITDVSSQGNEQPFLLNTEDGLIWTVSVEPFGEAHGVYAIYLIDARTGDISMKRFTGKEIGPVKACDYTRKAHPEVDWSMFDVIEPIPITPDGNLYWEVRVVPNDGSGISYVAFVNPISGEVVECKNDLQIREFINNQVTPDTNISLSEIHFGVVISIDDYVYNCYTNWVIQVLTPTNSTGVYIAKSEMLSTETISTIARLDIGNHIEYSIASNYIINLKLK